MRVPRCRRESGYPTLAVGLTALAVAMAGCAVSYDAAEAPAHSTEKVIRRSFPMQEGMEVELENLAGAVILEGIAKDAELAIEGTVHAAADSEGEATSLADMVELAFEVEPGRVKVLARYPVDRYQRYYYPGDGEGEDWFIELFGVSHSTTKYMGRRVTVLNQPRSGSAALYTDFRIAVPSGAAVAVANRVGTIDANGLEGWLRADTSSGSISLAACMADVQLETGSGDIVVREHAGEVVADTGSGDVELERVRGNVHANTGSGDVNFVDVAGATLTADTGSGDIALEQVSGSIRCDTGSGDVWGSEVHAGENLVADTGSGDVWFSGDLSEVREIEIGTGSGDVDLFLIAPVPALHLWIDTSGGSIDVDLPGLEIVRKDRRYLEARVEEGSARANIRTGSGDVTVRKEN